MFEELNQYQILKSVCVQNKYDAIAFAFTPWHALGVQAVIQNLVDKGIKTNIKCLIVICEHPISGYALSHKNFTFVDNCIFDFVYRKESKRSILGILQIQLAYLIRLISLRKSNTLYVISPCLPSVSVSSILSWKLKSKVVNYYYDEGLLTYFLKRERKRTPIQLLNAFWSNVFARRGEDIPFLLFNDINGKLIANTKIVSCYKRILIKSSIGLNVKKLDDTVLICTQMYGRDGLISEKEELEIYKHISIACKSRGVRVLIKPHPRDNHIKAYEDLENVEVYRTEYPLESILMLTRPISIISITSTVLVSSLLFNDVEAISLCRLFNPSTVHSILKNDINSFVDLFDGYIKIPFNIDELLTIIKNNIK